MAQFAGGVSYTPFFKEGMGAMSDALTDRWGREKTHKQNVLMGKVQTGLATPEERETAAMLDPEGFRDAEDQAMQRKRSAQQTDLHEQNKEANRRKFAVENRELMQELTTNIGAFDDYETARQYSADQVEQLKSIMGEENVPLDDLSPEQYEQFKELRGVVTGKDWQRSGEPKLVEGPQGPMYMQAFVNPKTQETRAVPMSEYRAITAHDPNRAREIAEGKETGKLTAQIDLADDKVIADMSAEAKTQLIPARVRAQATLGIIEQLRNHPGLEWATGVGWLNPGKYVPGTKAHAFTVLANQARGKVFAEAYETLKGGGQITEIEARKAEQAIARLETSVSVKELRAALDEFEQATRDGYLKLRKIASTTPAKFKQLMAGELSAPLPETGQRNAGTINNPHRPESRVAYDAIPSGTYFMDPNGEVRRKP